MSIIESAKANDINPYDYVQYLLEMIPKLPTFANEAQLAAYLPWNYKNMITKLTQVAYIKSKCGVLKDRGRHIFLHFKTVSY